uniref:Uncharacterized protein n=1 Tax=Molossus molossus TaxID=27622 RepID=A0A7J8EDV6_MOLMO|nr:hypothetical protein HJG59_008795 [Molossus molossus]
MGYVMWRWIGEAAKDLSPHLDQILGKSRLCLDVGMWRLGAEDMPPCGLWGQNLPPWSLLCTQGPQAQGMQPHCPLRPQVWSPDVQPCAAGHCAEQACSPLGEGPLTNKEMKDEWYVSSLGSTGPHISATPPHRPPCPIQGTSCSTSRTPSARDTLPRMALPLPCSSSLHQMAGNQSLP